MMALVMMMIFQGMISEICCVNVQCGHEIFLCIIYIYIYIYIYTPI
jgi:hypothetical protein